MFVRQVSVFIENSPGKLAEFTRLLGEGGVDLLALTLADTANYGIARCLVTDPDGAASLISKAGYSARVTEVLSVVVPDKPGGLADALDALAEAGVSVEYCYSFAKGVDGGAALVIRVDHLETAAAALAAAGVRMLDQEQIAALDRG